ncbi:MAG: hypothetical protein ACYDCW_12060 [Acidithiobacillus ferrivorans]
MAAIPAGFEATYGKDVPRHRQALQTASLAGRKAPFFATDSAPRTVASQG